MPADRDHTRGSAFPRPPVDADVPVGGHPLQAGAQLGVSTAETGRGAIEILQNNGDIDVVLMDIMMPDMDGYDTMRAIRNDPEARSIPIVALTAKAMKGDREKCLEAGASDYLAKPVVTDQLLGVLRQWLHR